MKRRTFFKVLGGIAGLGMLDLEKALAQATKVFDKETNTWYVDLGVDLGPEYANQEFTFSCWARIGDDPWAPVKQKYRSDGEGKVAIKIPMGKNKDNYLARPQLEQGIEPTPFKDEIITDTLTNPKWKGKNIMMNDGFEVWKPKKG